MPMQINKWSGILVYIESQQGRIKAVSLELLGEAIRLASYSQEKIYAVAVGETDENMIKELIGYQIEALYFYETKETFQAMLYEKALVDCIINIKPSVMLIGGTNQGRALAPRVAVAFETGLTADCTELSINGDGCLIQTRPAFGGNIMASILTENTRPQIATVRPGIFMLPEKESGAGCQTYIKKTLGPADKMAGLISKIKKKHVNGIEKQDILIAAGRGVKKQEDLDMLRELAALMGGKLASSRALVEKGWMKPEEQIGLSGTTVKPKCLITFGISGTVQFLTGMKNTPNIIAVNTDSEAKIFEYAHYPICADLYEVVPVMIEKLKNSIA